MEYRVEDKFFVTDAYLELLAARLRSVMAPDEHQQGRCYEIRSLYFDDMQDRCMDENEAGVDERRKYRIRLYDPDSQSLRLEIKEKADGKTKKISCSLSRQETRDIMDGTYPLTPGDRTPLNLLQLSMRCTHMEPKAVIAYERTAFVHPVGNVRITFDRNITASSDKEDLFSPIPLRAIPVLPAGMHILEVKYDELLPDVIAKQLQIGTLQKTAFSKYYLGRLAIQGYFPTE